jgi:hypothetical protein
MEAEYQGEEFSWVFEDINSILEGERLYGINIRFFHCSMNGSEN